MTTTKACLFLHIMFACVGVLPPLTSATAEGDAGAPIIRELKKLYPQTTLVENGQAVCAIVLPEKPEYTDLARKLIETVRAATGAALTTKLATELIDDDWRINFESVSGLDLIALGNVNNNRLLSVLYGERYVVADSIYPGEGGYVIRTVHDPFANGVNVLVLAGSNPTGVAKAISVFTQKLVTGRKRNLVLDDPMVDLEFEKKAYRFFPDAAHSLTSKRQPQYTGMAWFKEQWRRAGFMDEAGKVITNPNKATNLASVTGALARMGQTFFRTGNRDLLPFMKELIDKNRSFLKNPPKLHGMGGRSAGHVHEWDLLEELPIWTDQDRLDITNALLMDASLGHERRAFQEQVKEGCVQTLDENHGTFSALRSFNAWLYFHKYYDTPESDYWLRCADAVFSAQASTHQILEDASGYLCYCPMHAMSYSLKRRNLAYFKRGIALTHAKYVALASINNLGLNTGFGDSSNLVLPEFFEVLAPAAWFYRDPRLDWIIRNKLPQSCGLRIFQKSIAVNLDIEPQEPADWTGLIRWPLYGAPLVKGQGVKEAVFAEKKDVDKKLFNKIIFKENWSEDGQYILLDGAGAWGGPPGPHGHKHDDINTIINFTSHRRMWLVDHTYQTRAFQDHSGLYVTCNGKGGYRKRTLAQLKNLFETDDYGLTRTRFMNWERSIFWRKGRYFVVQDRAIAEKSGDYFARCSFRALGEDELRGRILRLAQGDKRCEIISDGASQLDVERYEYGNRSHWGKFYPHAKPVVKIFQQDKTRTLKKGESLGFMNLLYAYDTEHQKDRVTMRPVSEDCALISDGGAATVLGAGKIPGEACQAPMFLTSEDTMIAIGAASLPGELVQSDGLCDICLDSKRKLLRVESETAIVLRLAGLVRSATESVKPLTVRTSAGRTTLRLTSGEHVIAVKGWNGFQRVSAIAAKTVAVAEAAAARERKATAAAKKREVKGLACRTVKLDRGVRVILPADLDGSHQNVWLIGTDSGLIVCRPDGALLWSFDTTLPVRATDAGDADGDGNLEIAVGCDDEHVYLLTSAGKLRWSYKCKASNDSISKPPSVDYVKIVDLEADGKMEVVVGANWVHVLDATGKLKWERYMDLRRGRICGDFVCGTVADINGDGVNEIVALFLTSYPLAQAFDSSGRLILPANPPPEGHNGLNIDVPLQVAALDLFGGKRTKQIVYSGTSRIGFLWHDQRPREQAGGKVGGPFTKMTYFQQDPALPPMIFGATAMCGLVGVKPGPRRNDRWITADIVWSKNFSEKISALATADVDADGGAEVYVGGKAGGIYVVNAVDGAEIGHAKLGAGIVTAIAHDQTSRAMLVGKSDGSILVVAPSKQ